jgi:hypothetical protein
MNVLDDYCHGLGRHLVETIDEQIGHLIHGTHFVLEPHLATAPHHS